jgi:hypothetical protein
VLRFLRNGGREAIITSCEHLSEAVAGSAGTHVVPDLVDTETQVLKHAELPVGGC